MSDFNMRFDAFDERLYTSLVESYSEEIYDTPENQKPGFKPIEDSRYHFICRAPDGLNGMMDLYLFFDPYNRPGQERKEFVGVINSRGETKHFADSEPFYHPKSKDYNSAEARMIRYARQSKPYKEALGIK